MSKLVYCALVGLVGALIAQDAVIGIGVGFTTLGGIHAGELIAERIARALGAKQ